MALKAFSLVLKLLKFHLYQNIDSFRMLCPVMNCNHPQVKIVVCFLWQSLVELNHHLVVAENDGGKVPCLTSLRST